MAVKITEECIYCGSCEPTCPNDAISPGDDYYEIDPARCTECLGFYEEQQCMTVCPTDAIIPDDDHEDSKEELLRRYEGIHPDRAPDHVDTWSPAG